MTTPEPQTASDLIAQFAASAEADIHAGTGGDHLTTDLAHLLADLLAGRPATIRTGCTAGPGSHAPRMRTLGTPQPAPAPPPAPAGLTTDQQIRTDALRVAAILLGDRAGTDPWLDQVAVGMADRLVPWIRDGRQILGSPDGGEGR